MRRDEKRLPKLGQQREAAVGAEQTVLEVSSSRYIRRVAGVNDSGDIVRIPRQLTSNVFFCHARIFCDFFISILTTSRFVILLSIMYLDLSH